MHKFRWAVAATGLAVGLAMGAPTSALAQPSDKPPPTTGSVVGGIAPPAGASWTQLMSVQARLDAKAESILALRDANFTGIAVAADKDQLTVYWKGQPPAAAAAAIKAASRGDSVQLLNAQFSEAELLVEVNKVVKAAGVTAVSPNVDGTGLSVSLAPNTRLRAPLASAVPITQTDTAAPQVNYSRSNDSPPYYGGGNWSSPGGGCSTGFAINIGGTSKMLSAGHCAANGNTARDGGGDVMGTISGDNNAYDRLYINTSSAGRVFNGGPGSGEFTNPVIGALHSFVGDYICTTGAYSGTRCSIQVKATNQSINVGYTIFQTVRAEQINHTNAVGQGDSGGPVEQVASDTTKVYAKGTNTAIDGSTAVACTGVVNGRTCAWRMYYVDVVNSLNAYGASIITG